MDSCTFFLAEKTIGPPMNWSRRWHWHKGTKKHV